MDYLRAKFGDFIFSRFGFIVRTDRQTDRQTDRLTEGHDCYTHATTVDVSDDPNVFKLGIENNLDSNNGFRFQYHRLGLELGLGLRHSLRRGFELYECLLVRPGSDFNYIFSLHCEISHSLGR